MLRLSCILTILALALFPLAVRAAEAPLVTVTTTEGTHEFSPFSTIGSVAAADLGDDGIAEIIVGAGAGNAPAVGIYRQDGSVIGSFFAYAQSFAGGVNVAACDVDGDGVREIVTGARFGGGPHVRIFDHMGAVKYAGFFAYAEDFRGGVYVACGDVDGDGIGDVVTGAGPSGGPHVKVFDAHGTLRYEVFDGSASENTGAFVRVEDGVVYTARVGVGDAAVHAYTVNTAHALVPIGSSTLSRDTFFTSANLEHGTVTAAVASELYANTAPKLIHVDVSEQRLTRYAYGIAIDSVLVSTGVYGYDTPYGTFSVLAKLPMHTYGGATYYYPNTPWNLRFKPSYYIHTAYWHNNFGHRMSHGCVNMREADAAAVYTWADVGTPVEIVP